MGRSYTKVILVALPAPGGGGEYRFQGRADWELWTYPSGTVVLNEDGSIGLRRYRKNINAAANASEFERASKDAKGMVPGGILYAPSNPGTADRVIDGDPATWWRPSAADELGDWWLEVDLGRSGLATKIRIVFPDSAGVKPFRFFSVFAAEGARVDIKRDLFQFTRIGATTRPNTDRVVEYQLSTVAPGEATGANLVRRDTLDFALVRHLRFVADAVQSDAAVHLVVAKVESDPEVEIFTLGGKRLRILLPGDGKYWWNGRDLADEVVPPGVYICRIRVPAAAGDETAHRIINVAY